MVSALKGALSGSLETVILGLMKSTTQYDASLIRGSIKVKGHRFDLKVPPPSAGQTTEPLICVVFSGCRNR